MQAFAACEPTRVMRGLSHVRVRLDHLRVAGHEVGDLRPRRGSPRPRRVHGEAPVRDDPLELPIPAHDRNGAHVLVPHNAAAAMTVSLGRAALSTRGSRRAGTRRTHAARNGAGDPGGGACFRRCFPPG
jgi:hypothetical protein